MSGFITTMFVSSSAFHPAFPAKPKPLLPIFTFAQSQSCMNLGMKLDVLDYEECGTTGEIWSDISHSRSGLDLARPQEAYQSPLQKIGEALRTQQPPTADKLTNYSYKHQPDGITSKTNLALNRNAPPAKERDKRGSMDTGSIISPSSRAQAHTPRNNGYFAGTSLLSSFFSNPRTRAPFKPQKSNRGTSSWQLKQYAEATLGSGSLRKAVKLPEGEDKDEWLAVNGTDHHGGHEQFTDSGWQWSISTTRSICCTVPSRNSAHPRPVQK